MSRRGVDGLGYTGNFAGYIPVRDLCSSRLRATTTRELQYHSNRYQKSSSFPRVPKFPTSCATSSMSSSFRFRSICQYRVGFSIYPTLTFCSPPSTRTGLCAKCNEFRYNAWVLQWSMLSGIPKVMVAMSRILISRLDVCPWSSCHKSAGGRVGLCTEYEGVDALQVSADWEWPVAEPQMYK